jgi:dephospho-CoA kinase
MKQNKRVIGLTGTIASGKSTAAACFSEQFGIPVIDADQVGHTILQDASIRAELVEAFGPSVCDANGAIDRKMLGALVFADEEKRYRLNAITHPAICAAIRRWIEEEQTKDTDAPFLLIEAIELLRSELADMVDEVWVVYADPHVRASRMMKTRGLSREEAEARIRSQWDDAKYRARASRVLDGNGTMEEMRKQCAEAYAAVGCRIESDPNES